jgi:hypothetical protein
MVNENTSGPIDYAKLVPPREESYIFFEDMIGIEAPFYISALKYDKTCRESHITISFIRKVTFPSPCCGISGKVHSYHLRIIRHLDIMNTKTYLHLELPKIKCPKCGIIHALSLPFLHVRSNLSVEFRQKVIEFAEVMPFTTASRFLGESNKRLADVVHRKGDK